MFPLVRAHEGRSGMWGAAAAGLKVKQDIRPEKAERMKYPRSPKALLGGIAYWGRFIENVCVMQRRRH